MELVEVTFEDQPPVDSYGPGFFRVREQVINGNMFLVGHSVSSWAGFADLSQIKEQAKSFDILFLGTGAEIAHLPQAVREEFEAAHIAVEVMSSPSACRTYNILLSEGRRVALAVLAV